MHWIGIQLAEAASVEKRLLMIRVAILDLSHPLYEKGSKRFRARSWRKQLQSGFVALEVVDIMLPTPLFAISQE